MIKIKSLLRVHASSRIIRNLNSSSVQNINDAAILEEIKKTINLLSTNPIREGSKKSSKEDLQVDVSSLSDKNITNDKKSISPSTTLSSPAVQNKKISPESTAKNLSPSSAIRLSKFLAETGLCSRREAEDWIINRRVAVSTESHRDNDDTEIKKIHVTAPSYQIDLSNRTTKVYLDGIELKSHSLYSHSDSSGKSTNPLPKLYAVYKMRGELMTSNDTLKKRPTIYDRLKQLLPELRLQIPEQNDNSNVSAYSSQGISKSTLRTFHHAYNKDYENELSPSTQPTASDHALESTTSTSLSTSSSSSSSSSSSNAATSTLHISPTVLRPVIHQEFNTEGLCLFSNNPILARILNKQKTQFLKTYRVKINGLINDTKIHGLSRGMYIKGAKQPSIDLKITKISNTMSWCTLTTYENSSKIIKNCLEHMHFNVTRMICTGYGPYNVAELNLSLEPINYKNKKTKRAMEVKLAPEVLKLFREHKGL